MIVLPVIVCGLTIKYAPNMDFYKTFWYLSIFVASMTCGWFCILKKIQFRSCSIVYIASSLSFGVFLCHILIMRSLLWRCGWISNSGWFSQILFTTILTVCIAFVFCYLVALLPLGKYLIGCQINNTIR